MWIPTKKVSKLKKKKKETEQVGKEFENPPIDPEEEIQRRRDKKIGWKSNTTKNRKLKKTKKIVDV